MTLQIPVESKEGESITVSHGWYYPTWIVIMNKVSMGRGWSEGISGEGSVMREESEVEKHRVLNCRHKEHWGKKIMRRVWLIPHRKCSELCFLKI